MVGMSEIVFSPGNRRGEAMVRVLNLKIKATMWSCVQL